MALKTLFGSAFQNVGSAFRLPELGISERFGVSGSPSAPMSVNPQSVQAAPAQQLFSPAPQNRFLHHSGRDLIRWLSSSGESQSCPRCFAR